MRVRIERKWESVFPGKLSYRERREENYLHFLNPVFGLREKERKWEVRNWKRGLSLKKTKNKNKQTGLLWF
jgi:hypothetical protein